ncbi:MAG TPA: PqqD family protein [Desulfatiglandales bacterium]|nr:PqqD family protein [Desulfatiglandales bacterium]
MKDIIASRRGFISAVMTIVPGVFIVKLGDLRAVKQRGKELLSRLEIEILESSMPKRGMLISSDTAGDKTTIYRETTDKRIPVCSMNNTGKMIWELCDGNHSLKEICGIIVERCQVTEINASRDILAFLAGLKKIEAITL